MSTPDELLRGWPSRDVCLVGLRPSPGYDTTVEPVTLAGDPDRRFALASVTKLLTATAMWIALAEGAVSLGDSAGPPGSTVEHLLSHASGLAPDDDTVLAAPATRRIYSNRGVELAVEHLVARTGIPFVDYLGEAVLEPLAMAATELRGSPAHAGVSTGSDLARWAGETLEPRAVLDTRLLAQVTACRFPGLDGVVPGFGSHSPNDWALGPELRGGKSPHWMATAASPATFGHFGRSGTFLWIDPVRRRGLIGLGDAAFGPWAVSLWPRLGDWWLGQA
ncbi:MAG: serine hydrolase domain-containing protein [Microthrixaceae bacterium]